jgi:hypothetical protein
VTCLDDVSCEVEPRSILNHSPALGNDETAGVLRSQPVRISTVDSRANHSLRLALCAESGLGPRKRASHDRCPEPVDGSQLACPT